jgi:hypothetical protein
MHARNDRTTELCNPFLGNGSINTLPRRQWRHTTVDNNHVTCFCWSAPKVYRGQQRSFAGSHKLEEWAVSGRSKQASLRSPREFSSWVPRFQGDWTRNGKKTSYWFEVLVCVLRSVARRRLVETANPSACARVNCKLCKSAISLY